MKSGLVSVTFRKLSPEEIVRLVTRAELDGIEWGGDVHVPHGDLGNARHVRRITERGGLETAAYGSYYRAGVSEGEGLPFSSVLETAEALEAPTIRVWAGNQGSATADAAFRQRVADDLKRIGEAAGAKGVRIGLEFHGHTLTDEVESALALMGAVGEPAVGLYWQPPPGKTPEQCRSGLKRVLPYLVNLHMYQWKLEKGQHVRQPLADGAAEWRKYLDLAVAGGWGLLEFVREDRPEQFLDDARVLKSWLGRETAS